MVANNSLLYDEVSSNQLSPALNEPPGMFFDAQVLPRVLRYLSPLFFDTKGHPAHSTFAPVCPLLAPVSAGPQGTMRPQSVIYLTARSPGEKQQR